MQLHRLRWDLDTLNRSGLEAAYRSMKSLLPSLNRCLPDEAQSESALRNTAQANFDGLEWRFAYRLSAMEREELLERTQYIVPCGTEFGVRYWVFNNDLAEFGPGSEWTYMIQMPVEDVAFEQLSPEYCRMRLRPLPRFFHTPHALHPAAMTSISDMSIIELRGRRTEGLGPGSRITIWDEEYEYLDSDDDDSIDDAPKPCRTLGG
ncbi:hypothetical protein NEOLEDRAFT_1246524 [Neolentinus lepideus HHB14362 ss-1]|uniref:Uncharacterized protein n=1 Tax=Neolentinus lepideus HHB14362 ss-1 TaxID=1314782 RepID=A0A165MFB8_9AGAM|nr:hypothetical protein NEOLEDRAFT_1246524 [Neolentinus lepideus HHB14362 ss-1]